MADVKARYMQAFQSFAKERYDEAISGYHEVIEADSSFSLAFQGLAEAHSRKGELDQAISAIEKAIELEPDEALYLTSLSRFLQRQGRIPEAEEAMARAAQAQSRSGS